MPPTPAPVMLLVLLVVVLLLLLLKPLLLPLPPHMRLGPAHAAALPLLSTRASSSGIGWQACRRSSRCSSAALLAQLSWGWLWAGSCTIKIIHFTGVRRPGDNELDWVNKSYGLMDKLETADGNRNVCQRSEAEIEEFLLQLSQGQRKTSILQDAAGRLGDESPATGAVIQLFSGTASDAEFEATVQSSKPEQGRCSAYFDALWYAEIMKDDAAVQRYRQHLLDIGKFHCGEALALTSKPKA